MAMFVMASCGSGNSPKKVTEGALSAMQAQKWDKLTDYLDLKGTAEEVAEQKEFYAELFAEKLGKDEASQIKSFKVISEEISEDGLHAVVTSEITDAKGETKTDTTKLVKNDKGEWKIDLNK